MDSAHATKTPQIRKTELFEYCKNRAWSTYTFLNDEDYSYSARIGYWPSYIVYISKWLTLLN